MSTSKTISSSQSLNAAPDHVQYNNDNMLQEDNPGKRKRQRNIKYIDFVMDKSSSLESSAGKNARKNNDKPSQNNDGGKNYVVLKDNDPTMKDVNDRIEGESIDLDPTITVKGVHTTLSAATETLSFDISGNQIKLDQNDTILSFTNPTYKTIMFEHFKTMGTVTNMEENRNAANELFHVFNERGGRFFKLVRYRKAQYQEVDAKIALQSKCDLTYQRTYNR